MESVNCFLRHGGNKELPVGEDTSYQQEVVTKVEIDKQIYKRFLSLLLGICLFLLGLTNLVVGFISPRHLSDQEIITKAKALGLVEMKDVLKEEDKNKK